MIYINELWKDIKGFEGYYQISSYGRVKSFKKYKNGYILSNKNCKGKYFSLVLSANEKKKSTRIHRLVAEAFIPNPNNYPCVNHKDLNKQNNCIDNLEWCTYQYNVRHSIANNPKAISAMTNYNKKIRPLKIYQYSMDNKLIGIFNNAEEAKKHTGVCGRNILQVAHKTPYNAKGDVRKQAGGFIWKFQ